MSVYQLDPAETAMLHELARNLDEIDALAALLADQPMVVEGSTGQPRSNPLLAELREHRKVGERLVAAEVGGRLVVASGADRADAICGAGECVVARLLRDQVTVWPVELETFDPQRWSSTRGRFPSSAHSEQHRRVAPG